MNGWLIAAGIWAGSALLGYLVQTLAYSRLEKFFARTETQVDDLLLRSLKGHIPLWFVLAGIGVGFHWTGLDPILLPVIKKATLALLFLSCSVVAARFLSGLVRLQAGRLSVALPTTSLTENLVKVLVYGLGLLLVLSNLGISITPLLTALGVGSLAVALALQDTLSNLFAGIYIIANRQIGVGDYIKLDSGQEGYVLDIGWRATRVRELPNNVIVIPNAKLSQSILTNYYLPEKEMSVVFQAGVAYGSDLKKVEAVTIETARETLKEVQGGVDSFEPFIRFHTFGQSSVDFSVILRVREYTDRYLVVHEFVKRLHARYAKENITIPFPQRVIWQGKEGS